jgi:FkbM family methyltransferase
MKELISYGVTQTFINRRFKSDTMTPVPYKHIQSITLDDGSTFQVQCKDDLSHFLSIREDYRFDDIRTDDIVIDIGANIGGFTIPAAKKSPWVCAIEPLFYQELQSNLTRNGVNAMVVRAALGKFEGEMELEYLRKKQWATVLPFSRIKEYAGGCDFLKCDCEGAEHVLTRHDLQGIRRIEMELHGDPISETRFLDMISRDFNYQYTCIYSSVFTGSLGFVHATRKGS